MLLCLPVVVLNLFIHDMTTVIYTVMIRSQLILEVVCRNTGLQAAYWVCCARPQNITLSTSKVTFHQNWSLVIKEIHITCCFVTCASSPSFKVCYITALHKCLQNAATWQADLALCKHRRD